LSGSQVIISGKAHNINIDKIIIIINGKDPFSITNLDEHREKILKEFNN